jgi:hypothetical protein
VRLKTLLLCAATLCLLSGSQAVANKQAKDSCALPPGLGEEISKDYANTKLVSLSDLDEHDRKLFQKEHGNRCPGLMRVDFYGDGKPTWALVLIVGENPKRRAQLVVAHQTDRRWESRSLETTDGTPVIWRMNPGKYADMYGKKTVVAAHPAIVFCGYESWAILYAWTGKNAEKVWLSD